MLSLTSIFDPSKSIRDLGMNGIKVYSSSGTFEALGINPQLANVQVMEAKKKYKIGEFTVMPFDIQHDVKEPFGFLIHHPDTGLILFATDTYNLKYQFPGVEIMIIEANYDQRVIDEKKENDTLHFGDYRVIKSHMSIQNCIKYIQKTDISKLRGIYLIHLSERNGNRAEFKTMVEKSTGIICEVCKKGDIYDIGNVVNF